jgi:hypothetical protein
VSYRITLWGLSSKGALKEIVSALCFYLKTKLLKIKTKQEKESMTYQKVSSPFQ